MHVDGRVRRCTCTPGSPHSLWAPLPPPACHYVQYEGQLAVVKRRKVLAVISLANSPALVPALAPLLPLAVHATAAAPATTPLLLRGRLLCGERDLVLARQQGTNLTGALRYRVRLSNSVATCIASSACSRAVLSARPLWMHALYATGFTPSCDTPMLQLSCWAAARSRAGSGCGRACWACCRAVPTWRCSTATS